MDKISTASQPTDEFSKNPILISTRNNLKLVFPFNIPPTFESCANRIITNLNHYKILYAIFVWSILFIALLPERKVSLVLLVGMTNITCLYSLFLYWFPNSNILHQIIDKRLVFFLLFIGTMLEMILTRAAVHFFVTLAGAIPVILIHALLSVRYCLLESKESCVSRGLVPIVYFVPFVKEKSGDYQPFSIV